MGILWTVIIGFIVGVIANSLAISSYHQPAHVLRHG
jgi:uncharacterized membrane protein YeaQ/YmgE (transglycosylase-associated protein family)